MNPREVEREFAAEVLMVWLLELMDLDGSGYTESPRQRWHIAYSHFLAGAVEARSGRGVVAQRMRTTPSYRAMVDRFAAAGQLLGWSEVTRLLLVLQQACTHELGADDHHVRLWSVLHQIIEEGGQV